MREFSTVALVLAWIFASGCAELREAADPSDYSGANLPVPVVAP